MIKMMKRILEVSGKYKGRIQAAFVFAFLKSMLSKAPVGMGFVAITALMAGSADSSLCIGLGIGMVVCVALQAVSQHTADRLQSAAGFMVFAEKRTELGKHLQKMPMGYFTEGNIGKISSVLSTDMVFIEENCMMALADMMSKIFAQIIMLFFLFVVSPWLGMAGLLILLVILAAAEGMKKEALADSVTRQEQSENLTEAVLDFVEDIGIIKAYNLLGEKSQELTENFKKSCETSLAFEEAHTPWQRRLNMLYGIGATLIVGAAMVLHWQGLVPTSFCIGMMLFALDVFGPTKALYGNISRLTVMNSCMDRIEDVFEQAEIDNSGTAKIPAKGAAPEIEFCHVSFGYGKKEVLHDISFQLQKNQMCALVGPSGGGKSTIANLTARFWDIKQGNILVRGQDIRTVPLFELMDHISMVFQRVYLFQDTVYNNISMGRPLATREAVYEAAKKARCYDFIMQLPNGFDTVIGEGGESLSGGEKQRISIARCILKDAPIVILDEATASVDADNERYIQEAISELCRGKTLIVIAHRLNTIQDADQILVVSGGMIEDAGTHEELISREGTYQRFISGRKQAAHWKLSDITL